MKLILASSFAIIGLAIVVAGVGALVWASQQFAVVIAPGVRALFVFAMTGGMVCLVGGAILAWSEQKSGR